MGIPDTTGPIVNANEPTMFQFDTRRLGGTWLLHEQMDQSLASDLYHIIEDGEATKAKPGYWSGCGDIYLIANDDRVSGYAAVLYLDRRGPELRYGLYPTAEAAETAYTLLVDVMTSWATALPYPTAYTQGSRV